MMIIRFLMMMIIRIVTIMMVIGQYCRSNTEEVSNNTEEKNVNPSKIGVKIMLQLFVKY